jgi:hypothetical protein
MKIKDIEKIIFEAQIDSAEGQIGNDENDDYEQSDFEKGERTAPKEFSKKEKFHPNITYKALSGFAITITKEMVEKTISIFESKFLSKTHEGMLKRNPINAKAQQGDVKQMFLNAKNKNPSEILFKVDFSLKNTSIVLSCSAAPTKIYDFSRGGLINIPLAGKPIGIITSENPSDFLNLLKAISVGQTSSAEIRKEPTANISEPQQNNNSNSNQPQQQNNNANMSQSQQQINSTNSTNFSQPESSNISVPSMPEPPTTNISEELKRKKFHIFLNEQEEGQPQETQSQENKPVNIQGLRLTFQGVNALTGVLTNKIPLRMASTKDFFWAIQDIINYFIVPHVVYPLIPLIMDRKTFDSYMGLIIKDAEYQRSAIWLLKSVEKTIKEKKSSIESDLGTSTDYRIQNTLEKENNDLGKFIKNLVLDMSKNGADNRKKLTDLLNSGKKPKEKIKEMNDLIKRFS